MQVKDKEYKVLVDVAFKECPTYKCYWPRPNPGVFTPGRGYRHFGDKRDNEWLCGHREIHGCPNVRVVREEPLPINAKENRT